MTIRHHTNFNLEIGYLLESYRRRLTDLPQSRQKFIDDRSNVYFGGEEWISEKTLANYENGKNVPTLKNIKKLAVALEVDEIEFIKEILKYI